MNDTVTKYLEAERVGVLAIETEDGSPYGAVMHFACSYTPLKIFLGTSVNTSKGKSILAREKVRASFVVGTDEEKMITFQATGVVQVASDDEKEQWAGIYLGKFPEKETRVLTPESVWLVFVPTWWRWSDMKNKEIVLSE